MKDRILESYINDFVEDYALKNLQEHQVFERFVNFCVISREQPEDPDLDGVSVGGTNDVAIDGIAIFVNEHLVFSKEDVDFFKNHLHRLDVEFIFIQSKGGDSFDSGEIGNFLFGVKSFFDKQPLVKENARVQQFRDLKEYVYKASIDMEAPPTCRMYYATTGKWTEDVNLAGRVKAGVEELVKTKLFSEVKFFPLDADKLKNMYKELKLKVVKEVTFDKHTILPSIVNVKEAYIGILPLIEYLKLITDADGNLLRSLFYDNVRDFQGYNPVNLEIQATLKSREQNDKFVLLNNGITIVAKSISKVGTAFKIKDYQIVNGCQTSHILFRNRGSLKDKVFLPVKIIVTDNPDVTNLVIKATNRQTEVKVEAFEALSPFQKKLEEFYNAFGKDKEPCLHY